MSHKPVIFLAFANDRDDTVGYLRNLPDEARRLREMLERAEQAGLCEVVVRPNSTAGDIFKVFQDPKYRNRIAIFHYGGHANGYQLLLESSTGESAAADAGGLAAFLAQQRGLQLVFLNGCSTQQQTDGLLDANVSAVISTSRAIDDAVATDFSCHFYRGLAGGATIRTAYNEAEAATQTATGGGIRELYFGATDQPEEQPDADRWPWNLSLREGSESSALWNLPEAVNDPLFKLPPLPQQDLPETPYRHLHWFTGREAEVFFGRGHQIRELYDRLTAPHTAPIALFYGQSGVGKSSLLDAGLIPRLAQDYEVRYLRRTTQGVLDTLLSTFSREVSGAAVESAWRMQEQRTGKPLIVFLDQVEECYTRPLAEMPDELDRLLGAIRATFAKTDQRPRGKLVLGFRKEWLAELEDKLSQYELPRNKVFLESLDRRGIIEVVHGPARCQRLRDQYGLTVEEGLAEIIADDLLADCDSAIAPTLQILLTKMWAKAKEENDAHPHFSQDLYQKLKRHGILLRDFLNQQIAALRERNAEAVESGLLLDVLALHTTPLGTADQCSVETLHEQYAHIGDTLPSLLQHCQDLHLLTVPPGTQKASTKTTRLAHDTLAPLIRERFENSDKPGQRARRILDNRSVDWEDDNEGTPLDEADLAIVEDGLGGNRSWNKIERKLVDASRELRHRRKRMRTLLGVAGVIGIILILGLSVSYLYSLAGQREQQRVTDAYKTIKDYGLRLQDRQVVVTSDSKTKEGIPQLVAALRVLQITGLVWESGKDHVNNELLRELEILTDLRRLDLRNCSEISDFSPLSKLTKLTRLDLSNTNFDDVSQLSDLTALRFLFLDSTAIQERPPVESLENLEELTFENTGIGDVSIPGHQALRVIRMTGCPATSLELTHLPQLEKLYAQRVTSLATFRLCGIPSLKELQITKSKLSSIELVGFGSLERASLPDNPVLKTVTIRSCNKCKTLSVGNANLVELWGVYDEVGLAADSLEEIEIKTDSEKLSSLLLNRGFANVNLQSKENERTDEACGWGRSEGSTNH